MEEREQVDIQLKELIELIHFTEKVSSKIHGLLDEAKIYRTVIEEFAKSKQHNATIFFLTDDGSKLTPETSISTRLLRAAEKATGLRTRGFKIDLNNSSILSQVIREGKTLHVKTNDLVVELSPRPLSTLVSRIMDFGDRRSILTPLRRHGEIIGAVSLDSPELAEYFIPSVRSLTQHISTAVDMAYEHQERKHMEETLRESEERFRNLFELAPDAILTVNMKGNITSVNAAALRLTGYSEDDIVGKHFSKLAATRAADIPKFLKLFVSAIRGKPIKPIEILYHRKDGTQVYAEAHASFLEIGGKKIGIQTVLRNITERKRYEETLVGLHRHAQDLGECQSLEEVYALTIEAMEKTLNFDRVDILMVEGDVLKQVAAHESLPKGVKLPLDGKGVTVKAIREKRSILVNDIRQSKDYVYVTDVSTGEPLEGYQLSLSELTSPIIIGDEAVGVLNVESTRLNTFTEQYQTLLETLAMHVASALSRLRREEELERLVEEKTKELTAANLTLQEQNTRLQRLDEMKSRFVSTATHEIRTPLISIQGYIELIRSGRMGEVLPRIDEMLEVVDRNINRLSAMTDDLLDVQRIESGRLQISPETLRLQKVIEEAVHEIQTSISEAGQSLHMQVPADLPPVKADPIRISQVIINLLSNASKFTPEGGEIILRVEDGEDAVRVKVSDTGIGIRKEDLPKLFKPFPDIYRRDLPRGTGLGLSICKGIIDLHGGEIWAESEGEGRGASLTFTLPRHREAV